MNDNNTNSITNSCASTRYFFTLEQNIEPPPQDEFNKKIVIIEKKTTGVEEIVRNVASQVYSFAAIKEETKETYRQWNTELQSPTEIIIACNVETAHLYTALPFLPTKAALENMQLLNRLGLRLESVTNKIEQLKSLLESPIYADAVILYKGTISRCEKICGQKNRSKSLSTLHLDITTKKKEHFQIIDNLNKPYLISQIKLLHESVQLCYEATKQLKEQNGQLSDENTICTKLSALKLNNENAEKKFSLIRSSIEDRRKRAELITLRADLTLSSGWLESSIIKWANSDLDPLIGQMEQLAKELQVFEGDIHQCLEHLYEKSYEGASFILEKEDECRSHFETPLSLLAATLERIRTCLYDLLPTKQARAGLYYAARLSAYIEDIKVSLQKMFNTLTVENGKTIASIGHTLHFLTLPQNSMNTSKKTIALFHAAYSVSNALTDNQVTSKLNKSIIQCLKVLVAREGTKTITEQENSDKTWLSIVRENHKLSVPNNVALTLIIQYIIREITEWFYFSKTDLHIKLDFVLYLVHSNKEYKEYITEKQQNDPSFSRLCNAYKIRFNEKTLSNLILLFEYISKYKKHASYDEINDAIVYYSKAITQIYIINHTLYRESEKSHIADLVNVAIQEIGLMEESKLDYGLLAEPSTQTMDNFIAGKTEDDSYTTILLHLLSKALWLSGTVQEEATIILCAHFKKISTNFFSFSSQPINCLVAEFVINRAIGNHELCNYENLVLTKTLEEFSRSEQHGSLSFPKEKRKNDLKILLNRNKL